MKKQYQILLFIGIIFSSIGCQKEDPVDLKLIVYPDQGKYGLNILDTIATDYQQGVMSLSAILSEEASLRVKVAGGKWSMITSTFNQWTVSSYNNNDNSRIFSSINTGTLDGQINLSPENTIEVSVYENGNEWASWTKIINVE